MKLYVLFCILFKFQQSWSCYISFMHWSFFLHSFHIFDLVWIISMGCAFPSYSFVSWFFIKKGLLCFFHFKSVCICVKKKLDRKLLVIILGIIEAGVNSPVIRLTRQKQHLISQEDTQKNLIKIHQRTNSEDKNDIQSPIYLYWLLLKSYDLEEWAPFSGVDGVSEPRRLTPG